MTSGTQAFPSTITLPVPAAYRRYLLGQRIVASTFGMVASTGVLLVPYLTNHPHRMPLVYPIVFCLISLVYELVVEIRNWGPNHWFTINRKFMTIASVNISAWRPQRLTWFTDVVASVARIEWHGLPTLQIVIEGKRRKVVEVVFREEDRATVETQIIPLIETYRHRHRDEALTDLLPLQ